MGALGDYMLVRRCFIVYNRSWKAIIPSLIFSAAIGPGCAATLIYLKFSLPAEKQFASPYKQILTAMWSSTIILNVWTTGKLPFLSFL